MSISGRPDESAGGRMNQRAHIMSMSGRADEHGWARWASEGHQRSLTSIAGAVVGYGGGVVG